jgi:hypothetical protein
MPQGDGHLSGQQAAHEKTDIALVKIDTNQKLS